VKELRIANRHIVRRVHGFGAFRLRHDREVCDCAVRIDPGKDIRARLRHAKADTTANEYMQELPESMKRMVGSVYAMLTKGDTLLEIRFQKLLLTPSNPL
jgi:hypothetical protein